MSGKKKSLTVHDLFTKLQSHDRQAKVTVKGGKLYAGSEEIAAISGESKTEPEPEATEPEAPAPASEEEEESEDEQ